MIKLKENDAVGPYRVQYHIKEGIYGGTYRVRNEEGKPFIMKFFVLDLIPEKLLVDGNVREIQFSRKLQHDNVISYVDDGIVEVGGEKCAYLITNYFIGSLLSEVVQSEGTLPLDVAKGIIIGVLKGIDYLHEELSLNHNDLTPRNVLLDKTGEDTYVPRIIDMGHLCATVGGSAPFPVLDLTPAFCAPETFTGFYDRWGDAFSSMAVFYYMLCGKTPWPCVIPENASFQERKALTRQARRNDLDIQALKDKGVPDDIIQIIADGLSLDTTKRASVRSLLKGLLGEAYTPKSDHSGRAKAEVERKEDNPEKAAMSANVEIKKATGGGFNDVAGMESLKAELTNRVIWILRDREKAKKYRLMPPNGMILYGPPGCGKTFFAQKFAEESQFNFILVNGSDLGSIYVHGTQGKIADLFKEAAKKAPSIICFDEFDSFVPSRGSEAASHRPEEVNEFLGQLNNCSEKGIFVIGTTNRLDMIDHAILRKGRMDLHIEIPAPDARTRSLIFKIHLKDRPLDANIDYDELADKTENYAASDIAFIVNDAAMNAALADKDISQEHLLNAIKCTRSSLGGPAVERKKIGY